MMYYWVIGMRQAMFKKYLSPGEYQLLKRLDSPAKIQNFLDTLPINFETSGETYMSVRRTLAAGTAHCFEGALLAAAALSYHGRPALILDLRTLPSDEDHVVALFQEDGYWGAISKTNHPVLRYRDAIYSTLRELALSYFHEYTYPLTGKKTLREFSSRPFDLSRHDPSTWVTADEDLFWLVDLVDEAKHVAIASKKALRKLRTAGTFEMAAMDRQEWGPDGALHAR